MGGARFFSARARHVGWFVALSAFFGLRGYFKYLDSHARILASDYRHCVINELKRHV